jgi:hypothetical protein
MGSSPSRARSGTIDTERVLPCRYSVTRRRASAGHVNHVYPAVAADLRALYPKVRSGGLLAGSAYLDGVIKECLYGVKSAVDQFAHALGLAPVFTPADPPGS